MEPSIVAYNMFVKCHNGLSLDDTLEKLMPGITPEADLTKFHQLISLITAHAIHLPGNCCGWSLDHDDILHFLQLQPEQKVNIYNIDHHHDLGYEDSPCSINCSNWVNALNQSGHLNTYHWIGNNNSQNPSREQIQNLNNYISSNDIYMLQNIKFDKIFIATSPCWIPKKFHTLNNILIELLTTLGEIPIDEN